MMNAYPQKLENLGKKNADRLSKLPESVLVHILSFLRAHEAARTVLIRPFGNLWTAIDTLDFDDTPFRDMHSPVYKQSEPTAVLKFIRFVRHFLMLHKTQKVCTFRIDLAYTLGKLSHIFADKFSELEEWKLITELEMWLKFALDRGVEVLDLRFGVLDRVPRGDYREPRGENFCFPQFAWASDTLVELRLYKCDILEFPELEKTSLLRILELNKVGGLTDEVFSKIIHSFPLLQDLTVIDFVDLLVLKSAPEARLGARRSEAPA